MSEPENFVARWSRLKRRSHDKSVSDVDTEHEASAQPPPPSELSGTSTAQPPPAAFDPASLPSIESITAETDIRAFLQSGVPAELTKAALRRVWTSDPAIRDFIGIAENQWDFTDPTAMPGFGPLEATDDVGKLVAQAMGRLGEKAEQPADGTSTADLPAELGSVQCSIPAAPEPPATAGMQASGIPPGKAPLAETDEPGREHARVNAAAQNADPPAERVPVSNRRPHGSALPK